MPVFSLSMARPLLVGSVLVLLAGVAAAAATPSDATDAISTGGSAEPAARNATVLTTTSSDGTAPGLRAHDETCGNTFWVGNFGRTPPLCRTG